MVLVDRKSVDSIFSEISIKRMKNTQTLFLNSSSGKALRNSSRWDREEKLIKKDIHLPVLIGTNCAIEDEDLTM